MHSQSHLLQHWARHMLHEMHQPRNSNPSALAKKLGGGVLGGSGDSGGLGDGARTGDGALGRAVRPGFGLGFNTTWGLLALRLLDFCFSRTSAPVEDDDADPRTPAPDDDFGSSCPTEPLAELEDDSDGKPRVVGVFGIRFAATIRFAAAAAAAVGASHFATAGAAAAAGASQIAAAAGASRDDKRGCSYSHNFKLSRARPMSFFQRLRKRPNSCK